MTQTPPRERFTFCYRLAIGLSALLFHTVMPVRYHGRENIALDAPFIVIGNHNSMLDPMLVGYAVKGHQVRFLGKKELEKVGILRKMFKALRMIAVDRHNMDMAAMRACLNVLKEGHVLGVFPEGTRHKRGVMEELESGTALIALRSKAPLIPAYITNKAHFFRSLDVYFGKPIDLSDLIAQGIDKDTCEETQRRITETYRRMTAEHPFLGKNSTICS